MAPPASPPPTAPPPIARAAVSSSLEVATDLGLKPNGETDFAFGEPPAWLVAAAAAGCHSLSDIARHTSLEQHAGPIDALEQDPALLAEYNRWLMQASKRAEYLQERARETQRQAVCEEQKAHHAQRGAELQRAVAQRGRAVEEKQKLVRINQQKARVGKHEAAVRHQTKQMRDAAWDHYKAMVHSEVADVPAEVRQAKAALLGAKHAGAQTIKAATGAIERRKTALQEQREAGMRSFRSAPSRRTDNADTGGGGASSSRPAEAAMNERPDSSSTPLQMGETLAGLYTLGCPYPLWREVATRRDAAEHALVLRVPAPQLSLHHSELCKDGGPPDTLRWANYFHPCDPLGYPLASMVSKKAVVVDQPVKMKRRRVRTARLHHEGRVQGDLLAALTRNRDDVAAGQPTRRGGHDAARRAQGTRLRHARRRVEERQDRRRER